MFLIGIVLGVILYKTRAHLWILLTTIALSLIFSASIASKNSQWLNMDFYDLFTFKTVMIRFFALFIVTYLIYGVAMLIFKRKEIKNKFMSKKTKNKTNITTSNLAFHKKAMYLISTKFNNKKLFRLFVIVQVFMLIFLIGYDLTNNDSWNFLFNKKYNGSIVFDSDLMDWRARYVFGNTLAYLTLFLPIFITKGIDWILKPSQKSIEKKNILNITKDEIEISRTPVEVYNWVFEILDNIKSKDDITALRLKSSNEMKTFIEESYPLALFCNNYFNNSKMTIKQKVGSQSYDVLVENNDTFDFIEITNAIDGYHDKLRNEELNKSGSAPAIGNIEITGTKANNNRTVEFERIAISHETIKEKQLSLIKKSVEKKSKINYPTATILIVAFDDILAFKSEDERKELQAFIDTELSKIANQFSALYFVGNSGKTFLSNI